MSKLAIHHDRVTDNRTPALDELNSTNPAHVDAQIMTNRINEMASHQTNALKENKELVKVLIAFDNHLKENSEAEGPDDSKELCQFLQGEVGSNFLPDKLKKTDLKFEAIAPKDNATLKDLLKYNGVTGGSFDHGTQRFKIEYLANYCKEAIQESKTKEVPKLKPELKNPSNNFLNNKLPEGEGPTPPTAKEAALAAQQQALQTSTEALNSQANSNALQANEDALRQLEMQASIAKTKAAIDLANAASEMTGRVTV